MVKLDRRDHTAIVTIGTGDGANLLRIDILSSLHRIMDQLASDNSLRSVIIRGAGENFFIAGADLKELSLLSPEKSLAFSRLGQSLFDKMESLNKIVIAAVDGYCMGGGMDLLLACDLRYATPKSRFAHPGAKMGIITGFGGTYRLPAEVGKGMADQMFYTAKQITAKEAKRIGLINDIFDKNLLLAHCLKQARSISQKPAEQINLWKQTVAHVNFLGEN